MRYTRTIFFASLQGLIGFIISLYVSCLSEGKILIFGDIFSAPVNNAILTHPIGIVGSLAIINVLIMLIASYTGKKKSEKQLYDKMCKLVFDLYIRDNNAFENKDCKVSLLMLDKTIVMTKWYKWNWHDCLVVRGRHQTKTGHKTSRVKFLKGEGCAGKAYGDNTIVYKRIHKYDEINTAPYFLDCRNELNLPEKKVRKLNEKPSSMVSIPINSYGTDDVVGVLSVDSINGTEFDGHLVRKIESTVLCYRPFFK